MILVHVRKDATAVRATKGMALTRTFATAVQTLRYADGRREEQDVLVEPYEADVKLGDVDALTADDMAAMDLAEAVEFEVPDGKVIAGPERFELVDGAWHQVFDIQDVPPPAPDPTPEEKIGLTEGEIDALLERALERRSAKK